AKYHSEFGTNLIYRTANRVSNGPTPGSSTSGSGEFYVSAPNLAEPSLVAGLLYSLNGTSLSFDSYVYGFPTAASAVPRIGKAFYDARINGGILEPGVSAQTFSGTGSLTADFAVGTLTGNGAYEARTLNSNDLFHSFNVSGNQTDTGNWSTSATLGSASNSIAGSFTLAGTKTYTGNLNGNIYGPSADQIGGTFALTSITNGRVSGYLVGTKNLVSSGSQMPLASITIMTSLPTLSISQLYNRNIGAIAPFTTFSIPDRNKFGMAINPSSNTEKTRTEPNGVTFGGSDFSSSKSDQNFNAYSKDDTPPGYNYIRTANIYNYIADGQAGHINLTYSGFSIYQYSSLDPGNADQIRTTFMSYGQATADSLMPRSGSASYTGIAYGQGFINDPSSSNTFKSSIYNMTGSSSVNANFSTGAVSGNITLSGVGVSGEALRDFGSANFSGTINSSYYNSAQISGFSATSTTGALQGDVYGQFFGPNGQEVGGAFDLNFHAADSANGTVRGGFAAKGN
ncbi:MAG: transferrin-binding protein-like solute binding protein, partial [Novosphingobium sp.]